MTAYYRRKQAMLVKLNDNGRRLDRVLRKKLTDYPLNAIYQLIREGKARINGRKAKPSQRVKTGDEITLAVPVADIQEKQPKSAGKDQNYIKSLIVFENEHFIVFNKPIGLTVHGPESLADKADDYLKIRLQSSLSFHPGPLNRLDRNSSGLIFFSLSLRGAQTFSSWFKEGVIKKLYIAIFDGELTGKKIWEDYIIRDHTHKVSRVMHILEEQKTIGPNLKACLTIVIPLLTRAFAGSGKITLGLCRIMTGRTHQIRAQSSFHGNPLAGDRKYNGSGIIRRYILHAAAVQLPTGILSNNPQFIRAPLPYQSANTIKALFGTKSIKKINDYIRKIFCV